MRGQTHSLLFLKMGNLATLDMHSCETTVLWPSGCCPHCKQTESVTPAFKQFAHGHMLVNTDSDQDSS